MRACSLLVIPPPKEREPPPGGFPKDLSVLNLSSWASLVQDIASGLMVLPPNLGSKVSLAAIALLDLLEKTTRWVYCHFCYHLGSWCACMGAFPPSWSQVVGESLGCGVTASSGGMTAPGTPAAGMSGYLPPPPDLPPMDFTKWRLPPPEALAAGSHSPTTPPWGQEECRIMGHSKEDCGSAPPRWTGPVNASTTHDDAVHTPDDACPTATPGAARYTLPTSGATAKKVCGEGMPLQIKPPPWVAQHRTTEGLQREGRDMAAAPSVTQEEYQGWRVCSRHVRRVVCPPG